MGWSRENPVRYEYPRESIALNQQNNNNGNKVSSIRGTHPPDFNNYVNVVITSHGTIEPKNVFPMPYNMRLITFNQKGTILATNADSSQTEPVNYSIDNDPQFDISHGVCLLDRVANKVINSVCDRTSFDFLMGEMVSYKWDPGMTVENIIYKVNSTDILPGIAICDRGINGFYNFEGIIKAFEKNTL